MKAASQERGLFPGKNPPSHTPNKNMGRELGEERLAKEKCRFAGV
jgi:hypothetical protein